MNGGSLAAQALPLSWVTMPCPAGLSLTTTNFVLNEPYRRASASTTSGLTVLSRVPEKSQARPLAR
jgi:hypothetical protein